MNATQVIVEWLAPYMIVGIPAMLATAVFSMRRLARR